MGRADYMSYAAREAKRKSQAQRNGKWPSHVPASKRKPEAIHIDLEFHEARIIHMLFETFVRETTNGSASSLPARIALVEAQSILDKFRKLS